MRILPSHWKCHVRHVLHSTLAQQSLCMPSWHHGNSSQCKPISLPPPHWKGSVTHENKRHFLNHEPLSFQPSMIRGQGCARFHLHQVRCQSKLREMQFSSLKKTFFPKKTPAAEEDEDSTARLESQPWDPSRTPSSPWSSSG
jgi:hypothetical protein